MLPDARLVRRRSSRYFPPGSSYSAPSSSSVAPAARAALTSAAALSLIWPPCANSSYVRAVLMTWRSRARARSVASMSARGRVRFSRALV
jgi:hypothetical protein